MDRLGSIMVVAERNGGGTALRKAFILARHFEAHIELFLCDAEHAYALRHLYDRRGAEEARDACLVDARRYLEALRASIAGEDVRIEVDVACESPAYEGIVRKVLRSSPDLVVKEIRGGEGRSSNLGSTDWHLIRTCPAPLMLTHGRSWGPMPRFAAAVDVSQPESRGLARAIAHTAEYLRLGCGATLDLIYSEPAARRSAELDERALVELAGEFGVDAPHVHLLRGDPEVTLPRFTHQQEYDVVFLGALAHRRGFASFVGSLTERILEGLACDCVLVKPDSYATPVHETRAFAVVL